MDTRRSKRKEAATPASLSSTAKRNKCAATADAPPSAPPPSGLSSGRGLRANRRHRTDTVANPVAPSKQALSPGKAQAAHRAGRPTPAKRHRVRREEKGKEKAPAPSAAKAMDRSGPSAPHPPDDHTPSGSDEEDELGGDYGRNLASASSALQGLLRKLGAGFDDILPPGLGYSSGRLKGILANLKKDDSPHQMEALSQLCELLSISTEEALTTFPVDEFVPILVNLLNAEHNPDIMLLAARAITFLADVLPSSCAAIVSYDAVQAFCARLLNIEYIDLAEQSLQALSKIAAEHPGACLQAGGLCAVLSFLDFFPTGMQHVAVVTAANMASGASSQSMDQVKSAVPLLTNLLQHHDIKVVDNACLALSRLAEAISKKPANLQDFCSENLIAHTMQLVALDESGGITSSIGVSTYYGLIKLLATCSARLPMVAETLLEAGMSSTLRRLLSSSTLFSSTAFSPASMLRSVDQLSEVLGLANALLPSVPDATAAALSDPPVCALATTFGNTSTGPTDDDQVRNATLSANPRIMETYSNDLLDQLLMIYGGSAAPSVRQLVLNTITKVLRFGPPDILAVVLKDLPISSFISSLLSASDPATAASGLLMAEILMTKLPELLTPYFLKEGVVHSIELLAAQAPAPVPPPKPRIRTRSFTSRLRREEETTPPAAAAQASGGAGSPKTPSTAALRLKVASWALRFQKVFLADKGITTKSLDTEGLQAMRRACQALLTREPGSVSKLMDLLSEKHDLNISTFEFVSSGAVESLSAYLTGGDLGKEGKREALMERLATFVQEALQAGTGESPPLLALLTKLQESLASAETFPVLTSNVQPPPPSRSYLAHFGGHQHHQPSPGGSSPSRSNSSSLSNGLAALNQPFKLRLCRDNGESSVRDYSSNVVLIEPLATIRAIEDFLWPRVYLSEPTRGEGSSRASGSQAAQGAAAAGGSDRKTSKPMPIGDDKKGRAERMTRSAAARANASAAAAPSGRAAAQSYTSEEDQGMFDLSDPRQDEGVDTDGEEDLMFEEEEEEEDLDDLGMSLGGMHVHDVSKPAEGAEGSGAKAAGSGAAGAGSSAAAHAGAAASDAGRSRSPRDPKLQFRMESLQLEPTTTILQAILKSGRMALEEAEAAGAADDAGTESSPRLWEKVYTLTYGSFQPDKAPRVGSGRTGDAASKAAASTSMDGALVEVFEMPALSGFTAGPTCMHVLGVLRLLDSLNRHRLRLLSQIEPAAGKAASPGMPLGYIPRDAFISRNLSPKLRQQLQDVLSICGGSLPSWCRELVAHAPFLFPFEMRRRYFYCTAFGLARALQHLQQQQTAEGGSSLSSSSGSREMRLARLQRQKVRVNRTRILDSAVKVMELYASHRAVLEVEYVGEVGTGLGPTLEFYTLLSHELQRKGLGMWGENCQERQEAKAPAPAAAGETTAGGEPMIYAPHGLFPVPILDSSASSAPKVVERFRLLGRMMAKALQDNRLLDLPLSSCFYRAALARPLDLYDICSFDPQLGSSLVKLSHAYRARQPDGTVQIDGVAISDLCLSFTLPGQVNPLGSPSPGSPGTPSIRNQVYTFTILPYSLYLIDCVGHCWIGGLSSHDTVGLCVRRRRWSSSPAARTCP